MNEGQYTYQRSSFGGFSFKKSPAVFGLIIASSAVYLLQVLAGLLFPLPGGIDPVTYYLGLNPFLIKQFAFWQFFTYMFTHGGVWHILLNMFVLWMFGKQMEEVWGSRRFLYYYFFTGVFAGVCSYLINPALTVGASGAIYAILLAYGLTFPNRMIYLYMIIPIKAKYFVVIIGAIELISGLMSPGGGVAHFAHLGGLVGGVIYILIAARMERERTRRMKIIEISDYVKQKSVNSDVDRILDKVILSGIGSLTPEEKKILIDAGHYFKNFDRHV